jgi:hypothetical protein
MRRIDLLSVLLLFTIAQPAAASEIVEVGADSLLFSQIGVLVRFSDPGVDGATLHMAESISRIRIYGIRDYGSDDWEIPPTPVYLCPTLEMPKGLQWKFLDDDFGNSRTAVSVGAEALSVPAGNFLSAHKVEVTRDDQPSVLNEAYWYVAGVGLVKRVEYEAGVVVRKSELLGYDVQGVGFFPLVEGNSWQFSNATVGGEERSVGSLKDLFRR